MLIVGRSRTELSNRSGDRDPLPPDHFSLPTPLISSRDGDVHRRLARRHSPAHDPARGAARGGARARRSRASPRPAHRRRRDPGGRSPRPFAPLGIRSGFRADLSSPDPRSGVPARGRGPLRSALPAPDHGAGDGRRADPAPRAHGDGSFHRRDSHHLHHRLHARTPTSARAHRNLGRPHRLRALSGDGDVDLGDPCAGEGPARPQAHAARHRADDDRGRDERRHDRLGAPVDRRRASRPARACRSAR